MANGYTRQSASAISSGQPVASAPVNNEFNQLVSAFSGTAGHDHSGGTGLGPQLGPGGLGNLTGSSTGIITAISTTEFTTSTITGTSNKITVTNGNGVAGNPTISLPSGVISGSFMGTSTTIPVMGLYNPSGDGSTPGLAANSSLVATFIGVPSAVDYFAFENSATGNPATIIIGAGGTDSNINIDIVPAGTGFVGITSNLIVNYGISAGSMVLTGNNSVGGTENVVGNFSVNTSSFTVTAASGNTVVGGTLLAKNNVVFNSALTVTGLSTLGEVNASGIDQSPIGATTRSTGAFTTLAANGAVNFTSSMTVAGLSTLAAVTATSLNGATIGGTTPEPGTFTNLTATGTTSVPTPSYGNSSTTIATTAFVQAALIALYPVGSLYFNASSSTNPATLFGFGTWTAFAAGRVPIGVGTGTDVNSNTLTVTSGQTGGEYTHQLSVGEMPTHNHSINDPTHNHYVAPDNGVYSWEYASGGSGFASGSSGRGFNSVQFTQYASTGISINNNGSSSYHNNIQPYIGVYIWQRTA